MTDKPADPDEILDANEHIQYFYHADHLGSASYVTDALGQVSQHVHEAAPRSIGQMIPQTIF